MATYEVLEPGGHARLVSDIKGYANRASGVGTTQIADESVTSAKLADDVTDTLDHVESFTDPMNKNGLHGELAEGILLTADDVYPMPPRDVDVYGASTQDGTPTPDAPVEINSVDELTLHIVGKNLVESVRNGTLTSTGIVEGYHSRCITKEIDVTQGETYSFSCTATGIRWGFNVYNESITQRLHDSGWMTTPTHTVPVSGKLIMCISYTDDRTIRPSDLTNIQLERSSSVTDYEPYVGQSITIPIGNNKGRSLPDGTRDELDLTYLRPSTRSGWAWYSKTLVQRVDTEPITTFNALSIDSDERQMLRVDSIVRARANVNSINDRLFDKFEYQYSNWNYGSPGKASVGPGNGSFSFEPHTFASLADANAWAGANPIIAQFPLATPQTIDLGEVELPVMPSKHATVWCDGGSAQPTLSMGYERDVNIVISNMMSVIADAATS